MRRFLTLILAAIALVSICAEAQRNRKNEWLHIYGNFRQWGRWHVDSIDSITFDDEVMTVYPHGEDSVAWSYWNTTRVAIQPRLPLVKITTDTMVEDVPDRENFLDANFEVDSFSDTTNITTRVQVRGRGNSSWYPEKKPYRLKFDKKISLFGLQKAKSWCLINNVFDVTLMHNTVGSYAAELIGMHYPWHTVPVDVMFNGRYRGSYILTEKIGINAGSVDIDEKNSVMWEMDGNFDEDPKFMSPLLSLPVMLKDPDMDSTTFLSWKEDFLAMEKAMVEGDPWEKIDKTSFIKYLIINNLALNYEVTYPRSVFLWKQGAEGKYHFGPVWDFDWAFGKEYPDFMKDRQDYSAGLLYGYSWMDRLVETPGFIDDMRVVWDDFYHNHFPALLQYLEQYHQRIEPSQGWDMQLWFQTYSYDEAYRNLIDWLTMRAEYIDTNPYLGLY